MSSTPIACAALACALAATPTLAEVVTFDTGAEGWSIQNAVTIDPTGGNPGANLSHYQIDTFGVTIGNTTNGAFIGDYGAKGPVTLSIDVKVNQIWDQFIGNVARELVVELRDYDLAQNGLPWTSVWTKVGDIYTGLDWTTMSATIANPNSAALPAGWGGYGAEDPNTYEPILPAGVTFADVLAGVDEIVFTSFVPGYFYGFTNYDFAVDNIAITSVPAPASAVPALGLAVACCRRRRA